MCCELEGHIAEYSISVYDRVRVYALTEAIKEASWLNGLLGELIFSKDIPVVYSDNQSTICISKGSIFHERMKHISIQYHLFEMSLSKVMFQ